jgi:cytochrome c oxidase assembly factor CtaG
MTATAPLAAAWAADPTILSLVVVFGAWYWLGNRRPPLHAVNGGRRHRQPVWQTLAFYGALLSTLAALDSPIDDLSDSLLWVHMTQHLLLMAVTAPLLVLAAPWNAFWRPLPLGLRRSVAGAVVQGRWFAPLRAIARALSLPVVAWLAFNFDLALWHYPWFYDLTLQHTAVHYAEHFSFLLFGCLFWGQVIDSRPFHARLGYFGRAVFAATGSLAGWVLAVVLALAPSPLYAAYASLSSRPGGISALTDQQLAGGMMWGPGSIPYAIVVFWALYRWLGPEDSRRPRRSRTTALGTPAAGP